MSVLARRDWVEALTIPDTLPADLATLPGTVTVGVTRTGGGVLNALPDLYSLLLYQGDSFGFEFQVADETGVPLDLGAAQLVGDIRDQPGGDLAGAWTVTATADPTVVWVALDSATSDALPARAVWDLRAAGPAWRITLLAGTIALTPSVTPWPA